MGVTNQQVRKLMQEYSKTNNIGISSARAGISRKTGSKYLHNVIARPIHVFSPPANTILKQTRIRRMDVTITK